MPVYETVCEKCKREKDIVRKVDDRHDTEECCGEKMRLMISKPNFNVDYTNYTSMHDGTRITSKKQHRDHLKEHRLVEIGNEKPKPVKRDFLMPKEKKEKLKKEIWDRLDALPQT